MNERELYSILRRIGIKKITDRNNNIMGCCPSPDHLDNNPSWGISKEEPHLHGCFTCGYKGSLYDLLVRIGGYNVKEAARLTGFDNSVRAKEKTLPLFSTKNFVEKAEGFPAEYLYPYAKNAKIYNYMLRRGVSKRSCKKANLLYDSRQKRVVVPWVDNKKLVGITGLAINNATPKVLPYHNTKKGNSLYLPNGRINPEKPLILVEGEVDALKVFDSGFTNVGAIGFGRFTKKQEELLIERGVNEVICFFDADYTGHRITEYVDKKLFRKLVVSFVDYSPYYSGEKIDPGDLSSDKVKFLLSNNVYKKRKMNFSKGV